MNIHLLWREACKEWGEAVGGPAEYEIFAEKLLAAAPVPPQQGAEPSFDEWAKRTGYSQSMQRTHARLGWDAALAALPVTRSAPAAQRVAAEANWLPTAENINALPEPLRRYVADLETLCDPSGIVRENTLLKDCNRGLQAMYRKLMVTDWNSAWGKPWSVLDALKHAHMLLARRGESDARIDAALSAAGAFVEADRLSTALSAPGVERLRDFYNVGPVQRAAVESFADALAAGVTEDAAADGVRLVMQQALDAMRLKQRVSLWENDTDAATFRNAVAAVEAALSSPTSKTAEPAEARDAARYRWLREQHWSEAPLGVVVQPRKAVRLGHDCPALDRLDAAIDEAMAAVPAEANNMEKKNAD